MIYLDHAATTPVAREVADTMYDVLLNGSGNPSSQYPYGAAAKKRLEADRAVIAAALGCKPDELYFTSCGTESDNWAIRLAAHQNRHVGKHIITTAVEHSAVLEPCKSARAGGLCRHLSRSPTVTATSPLQQVADALREDTALVSDDAREQRDRLRVPRRRDRAAPAASAAPGRCCTPTPCRRF